MHLTPKDRIFAYFSFFGVGKLILAGLSNRQCHWHGRLESLQNYLRPLKSATAADIVIGTAMKRRKGTSYTLTRGPCENYFKQKRHYFVLAASGASDQDVWGVYGCNFSWRFQWHHRRPWSTSVTGDITDLFPSTFSNPWQLPTSMASLFLSLAINYRQCHYH